MTSPYLHSSSFHPPHLIKSLPKSQFIRIRRICTHKKDYWEHARAFISFYHKRGYNLKTLQNYALDIAKIDRLDLLVKNDKPNSSRIPLVIAWHNKFSNISKTVLSAYKCMIENFPEMKAKYPELPLVSYRRPRNIKSFLCKAIHWKSLDSENDNSSDKSSEPTPSRSLISKNMSPTKTVTNKLSERSCKIQGGQHSDSNLIYSAECLKHNMIYVGQTGDTLSNRFNRHRSDINCYPERCELPRHFSKSSDCSFDDDLQISVLEKIKGPVSSRLYKEDIWITRLNTLNPMGLNSSTSEFGTIYNSLFNNN
mgnify:CR=1 FL=1